MYRDKSRRRQFNSNTRARERDSVIARRCALVRFRRSEIFQLDLSDLRRDAKVAVLAAAARAGNMSLRKAYDRLCGIIAGGVVAQSVWTRIRKSERNGCARHSVPAVVHSDEWINIGGELSSCLSLLCEDQKGITMKRQSKKQQHLQTGRQTSFDLLKQGGLTPMRLEFIFDNQLLYFSVIYFAIATGKSSVRKGEAGRPALL